MSAGGDITVLIAVRGGSTRVPRKNIRAFAGSSMLEIKVKQALSLQGVSEVVVTSDDDEMLEIARFLGATASKRDLYYASDTVPMGDVYVHLASNLKCSNILWTPVTSPLVKTSTIEACIKFYNNTKDYDSVVTTNRVEEYLWLHGEAINYNPLNHPRSQDLPPVYALNFAANILPRELMIKKRNILGDNFYPYMISEIEAIDVDAEHDFLIAESLWNKY